MLRTILSAGGGFMGGAMFGAVLAATLAAQSPATPPGPTRFDIEFNGNPANWAPILGELDGGDVVWQPLGQRFDPAPLDGRAASKADRWVVVKVNGRPVSMWGWTGPDGRGRWLVSDQRTHVLRLSDLPPGLADSSGVVASKLKGGQILATDAREKAKVQTLMEQGPNCPSPERIPTPPLNRGFEVDRRVVLIVAVAAAGVVAGLALVAASCVVFIRGRRS